MRMDGANLGMLWVLAGVLAIPLIFLWYLSPLGLAFAMTVEGEARALLLQVHWLSYFIGLPAVIAAWVATPLLWKANRRLLALLLFPLVAACELLLAACVLAGTG